MEGHFDSTNFGFLALFLLAWSSFELRFTTFSMNPENLDLEIELELVIIGFFGLAFATIDN